MVFLFVSLETNPKKGSSKENRNSSSSLGSARIEVFGRRIVDFLARNVGDLKKNGAWVCMFGVFLLACMFDLVICSLWVGLMLCFLPACLLVCLFVCSFVSHFFCPVWFCVCVCQLAGWCARLLPNGVWVFVCVCWFPCLFSRFVFLFVSLL